MGTQEALEAGEGPPATLDPARNALTSGVGSPAVVAEEPHGEQRLSAARIKRRPLAAGLSGASAIVLILGLLLTGALAFACLEVYESNESRLLKLRVRELGLVLGTAVPSVQSPLEGAAELADATAGNPQKFRGFIAPYVGAGRQYSSVSLWPLGAGRLAPSVVVGTPPLLASMPGRAATFFHRAARDDLLSVTGFLNAATPSLGYEFNVPGAGHGFAVYAEKPLPADRRSPREKDSAFSDLHYAVYLGRTQKPAALLVTNLSRLPPSGRRATQAIPFGDAVLTVLVTPNGSLGGSFFESLPWVIAIGGVLSSLLSALVTERLAQGRRQAEQLALALDSVASANREMYAEQRSIAQTLQHALLPDALPSIAGLQASALYVPAGSGIDIGGDWYDIVPVGPGRALLLVGDVSGHGLKAATMMASTRHAALAYAAREHRPAAVLRMLSDFVSAAPHEHFATLLCILVDVPRHELTIATAGHPPPLLIEGGHGRFLEIAPGPPIGVSAGDYSETTLTVAPGATLLGFTDGLVERRGEMIDVGMERLLRAATARELPLAELMAELARILSSGHHQDDTAIMGVRWLT